MNMLLAMGVTAFLCVAIGIFPGPLYAILPYSVDYQPYTTTHVITQLQLLMFSALAFTMLMRTGVYPPELRSTNLDFDWIYRKLIPNTMSAGYSWLIGKSAVFASVLRNGQLRIFDSAYRHLGPSSSIKQSPPIGVAVLILMAVFAIFALIVLTIV